MKMRIIYLVLIAIILYSCTGQSNNSLPTVHIKMESNAQLEEFIANEKIIPLETNEECLIGTIKKIGVDSSHICISDDNYKEIFIFNSEGKYLSKINSYGRGPEEYHAITDFCIHNDLLYLLARANRAIKVYKIDGSYSHEITLNDWYERLTVSEDYILLYSGKSNDQLFDIIKIDHNGRVIDKFIPFNQNNSYCVTFNPFNHIGKNKYLIAFPFDRRVAILDKDRCGYKYKFDFQTAVTFSDYEMDNLSLEDISNRSQFQESLTYGIEQITQTNDDSFYIVVSAFYKEKGIRDALCKVNLKNKEARFYLIGEEINSAYPYFHNPIMIDNGKLYTTIHPFFIDQSNTDCNPYIGIYDIVK